MAKALTKAQLIARINELEEQCGLRDQSLAALQSRVDAQRIELDLLYMKNRPSRAREAQSLDDLSQFPRVCVRGEWFAKVPKWEGGRRVITYKRLDTLADVAQREHAEHHYGEVH